MMTQTGWTGQDFRPWSESQSIRTVRSIPQSQPYSHLIRNAKLTSFIIKPSASAAVLENIGTYTVKIFRHGNMDNTIKVRVETIDGSAVETEDYIGVNEILTFEPGEKEKEVRLELN